MLPPRQVSTVGATADRVLQFSEADFLRLVQGTSLSRNKENS
jgi:hypothetical protein